MVGEHGAASLPSVTVDTYNEVIQDGEGFVGDRATKTVFRTLLDEARARFAQAGGDGQAERDPLGPEPSAALSKAEIDSLLAEGSADQAAIVHTAVEEFALRLAGVLQRFLLQPDWKGTERVVVGGGFSGSRAGALAIGRAHMILREAGGAVPDLQPIRHHPDEAGLLGGAHLAPAWAFKGHDAILAMDVGGSNIRAGLVVLHGKGARDWRKAAVEGLQLWRHRDDKPSRAEALERMVAMLQKLRRRAEKEGHGLAPFLAVGCPGRIGPDGRIEQGAQNLPGDWEDERFNLVDRLAAGLGRIDGQRAHVVLHNDAVVQGLSELPWMGDVTRWGVLTVGTGLGNARFTNRTEE